MLNFFSTILMNSVKPIIPLHFISWKRLQTMLWHHNARVNSHQRWKQTRFRVCFHLWCELTSTMNVTKWQVSWNSLYRLNWASWQHPSNPASYLQQLTLNMLEWSGHQCYPSVSSTYFITNCIKLQQLHLRSWGERQHNISRWYIHLRILVDVQTT